MTIKHKIRYDYQAQSYTKANNVSQTVPDQTMSIPELMKRYRMGQDMGEIEKQPYYDEEGIDPLNGVDIRSLDISELQEIRNEVNAQIREKRKNILKKPSPAGNEAKQQKMPAEQAQIPYAADAAEGAPPAGVVI